MSDFAPAVDDGAVNQEGTAPCPLIAVPSVNMAKDVKPRLDAKQRPGQVLAALMLP